MQNMMAVTVKDNGFLISKRNNKEFEGGVLSNSSNILNPSTSFEAGK